MNTPGFSVEAIAATLQHIASCDLYAHLIA